MLASAGAKVALAARRSERLSELARELEAEGCIAMPFRADMSDAGSLSRLVADVEAQLGTIDILVNNVGIPDAQLATKMSIELIDQVLAINIRAPFILAREGAARLIAAGKPGRIVNLSSIAAYHYSAPGAALYATTKAAVGRMTEALAVEWARYHINVNAIAPGALDTEMMDGARQRAGDGFIEQFPGKRLADPSELDTTLLYLVSPASSSVTGTIVKVDDGQTPR